MLLDLAKSLGLDPKKVSPANKGEYHSACPSCQEGKDRFVIWEKEERYWCRRCKVSGGTFKFCRDYMGMTVQEAEDKARISGVSVIQRPTIQPIRTPTQSWVEKAEGFVEGAHKRLMDDPAVLAELQKEGGGELAKRCPSDCVPLR